MQNVYANIPVRAGPAAMNYSTSSSSSIRDPSIGPPSPRFDSTMQFPSSEILLGSYRPGLNGAANITPPSSTRMRASQYLNTSDPIAMHLLVETALGDSQNFEVLSFEELEELKREDVLLLSRIEATRRKLTLESKIRDAAKSMNRLYTSTPSSPKLGRRISGISLKRETMDRAEFELEASTKKCEELSRELYHLEQRSRQAQMRLLKHTAGVLQMTYRQPRKRKYDLIFPPNGRPDSPASLDGFQASSDVDVPENLDGFLDEMKSDRPRRRPSLSGMKNAAKQRDLLLSVGRRLEELNGRVRELIADANPEKLATYEPVPPMSPSGADCDVAIGQQLDYLNDSLAALREESRARGANGMFALQERNAELQAELETTIKESLAVKSQLDRLKEDLSPKLKDVNTQLSDILTEHGRNLGAYATQPAGKGPTEQLVRTQNHINNLNALVQSLAEAAESSRNVSQSNGDRAVQYETVVQGLWQIILAGEYDIRQRKHAEGEQLASKRAAGAKIEEDDELSPDEDEATNDEFSLPAFSTKVQWIVSKATHLREKQSNLRRRVQQQREQLNRAVSPSQDPTVLKIRRDHEKLNELYASTKGKLQDAEARLKGQDEQIKTLQGSVDKAQTLQRELEAAVRQRQDAEKALAEKDEALSKLQDELKGLESEVVRLTTDFALARAEVDAAYGSRSQRQADWAAAANTKAAAELEEVTKRNAELEQMIAALQSERTAAGANATGASQREEALKKELGATLADFEDLTRASVEAERERDALEVTVDKLREQIETLESQISEERVKWMGVKSPGGTDGTTPQQSMGAVMLKNEFKKMMRDTRTEHLKALRVRLRVHLKMTQV